MFDSFEMFRNPINILHHLECVHEIQQIVGIHYRLISWPKPTCGYMHETPSQESEDSPYQLVANTICLTISRSYISGSAGFLKLSVETQGPF